MQYIQMIFMLMDQIILRLETFLIWPLSAWFSTNFHLLPQNKLNICSFCLSKNVPRQKFGNLTTKISIDLKKNIGNEEQA